MSINQKLKGVRALVTGARGFIGRSLCERLRELGAQVVTLDRSENQHTSCQGNGREALVCDIGDFKMLKKLMDEHDIQLIYHCAGSKARGLNQEQFCEVIEANIQGTVNLLMAASAQPHLERIVLLGTGEEYGSNLVPYHEQLPLDPVSAYSFSKVCVSLLGEMMNRYCKMPITTIRPSVAYGPGQKKDMFLPALIESLIQDKPFPMTPGEQTRDFLYIEDLVHGLIRVGQERKEQSLNGVFNIGSGEAIKMKDLALSVGKLMGKTECIRIGVLPYRENEIMNYCMDIHKFSNVFDWKPCVKLQDGLRDTIRYYKEHYGEA